MPRGPSSRGAAQPANPGGKWLGPTASLGSPQEDGPAAPSPRSWPAFTRALANALATLEDEQYLILTHKQRGTYVQVAGLGRGALRLEAVSNNYLEGDQRLTITQIRHLRKLGWLPPNHKPGKAKLTMRERRGSPNYYCDLAGEVDYVAAAQLLVATNRQIYGVRLPGGLSYSAFWRNGGDIPLPALGLARPRAPKLRTPPALPRDAKVVLRNGGTGENVCLAKPKHLEDDAVNPAPEGTDFLWAMVKQEWDDKRTLVVLSPATFAHWIERVPVLHCSTWGELRETVTDEVYQEVCDLCGYGSFAAYTQHLDITGTVPLPGAHEVAAESYDPNAEPPADDAEFEAHRDIGACADGDWPPSVAYLMNEELPGEVIDKYATVTMTMFNGADAEIPARHKNAVLRDLAALGYQLFEEPRLGELVNCNF